jgi:protein NirF
MISRLLACLLAFGATAACAAEPLRGTGDLGLVIERGRGSVLVIETSTDTAPGRVEGLGELSHASAVFSRDERFAYVFGRDGGLSKVDLLTRTLAGRVVQGGNSIGGAISQDGRLVAVSNYEPGGVRIFDAATLALVADIPATYGQAADGGSAGNKLSKVIGLVDAPGRRFVFSLWDAGEIWVADLRDPARPEIRRFKDIRPPALRRPHHPRRPILHRRALRRGRPGPARPLGFGRRGAAHPPQLRSGGQ